MFVHCLKGKIGQNSEKKNKVVLVYCFANAQRYGSNLIIFFVHNKLSNSVLIQFLGGLTFSQV